MHDKRGRSRGKSRAALFWALAFFLGGQTALGLLLHYHHPEMCDPEYQFRLRNLRARLAEAPGRPLALILGSSRTANGLRPASVQAAMPAGDDGPVLYNFAIVGAGPVRERMILRRLLTSGIRPDWLFVEVWPPFLPQTGFYREEYILLHHTDLYWTDVPLLARLYRQRWQPIHAVFAESIAPAIHARLPLLNRYANFLLPRVPLPELRMGDRPWRTLDGWGWLAMPFERADPETFARQMEQEGKAKTKPILDDFRISAVADQALRDLLDECRAHGIRTALFLMPEHSALRSWYPPKARALLSEYLRELGDIYQTPVIDARAWCDDDDFADFCHLLPRGAHSFSQRFGREVYRPLLEGQRPAEEVLLRADKGF